MGKLINQPAQFRIPPSDGLRAARGVGVIENPADDLDQEGRWAGGYSMLRHPCKAGGVMDPCGHPNRTPTREPGTRDGQPFVVWDAFTCSLLGLTAEDLRQDAITALNLAQYHLVASELWRGDQAQASSWPNVFLAKDSDPGYLDLVTAAGGSPVANSFSMENGLAAMEDALAACTDGQRVIHAPPSVVSHWDMGGALRFEGGRIWTIRNTLVISDSGYDGSGPVSLGQPAAAPAGVWIYGTGPLLLRLDSNVTVLPPLSDLPASIRFATNDQTFYAEKLAMITWDCCHVGARLSLNPVAP